MVVRLNHVDLPGIQENKINLRGIGWVNGVNSKGGGLGGSINFL